jgi:hypothetical protein
MTTTETYIIRGRHANGTGEVFYTGRAGQEWVNPDRREAFTGYSLEGARRKARCLNEYCALHGYWFVAVPA